MRALLVLEAARDDETIPGGDDGFVRLIAAQALGDARALADAQKSVAKTVWTSLERWVKNDESGASGDIIVD